MKYPLQVHFNTEGERDAIHIQAKALGFRTTGEFVRQAIRGNVKQQQLKKTFDECNKNNSQDTE